MKGIQHLAPTGTPFVWDKFIPAGKYVKDADGLWHVGEGTDLRSVIFDFSLSEKDKSFLKAMRIGCEG